MVVNGDNYNILIDDEDKHLLDDYRLYIDKRKTATYFKRFTGSGKDVKTEYLHRVITGAHSGKEVDHINCDTLDNRKCNLRICSRAENSRNRKNYNGKSKYKGVYYNKHSKKWQCQISHNNKNKYLGRFDTEEEAAIMYNIAAMIYYKDYARLNDPRLV